MTRSEIAKSLAGPVAAFVAAWLGAHLAFRKTRKERALDRSVIWHVDTIEGLARYQEGLKRLHSYSRNALVVQRVKNARPDEEFTDISDVIRVPAPLWQDLRTA